MLIGIDDVGLMLRSYTCGAFFRGVQKGEMVSKDEDMREIWLRRNDGTERSW